jgi:hypothetical protein
MNGQDVQALLAAAGDSQQELPKRIRALQELAGMQRQDLTPQLLELWKRSRPAAGPKPINWDPEAAERVVDLYIILALAKAGDVSLLPKISSLVAQAGTVLQGPDSELGNAAKVIRSIGQLEPISDLVGLAGDVHPEVVANAVRTLQLLDLPAPPSGGPLSEVSGLAKPVSFTIHRLKEELETIARLSNGRIVLSEGTKTWISQHDYDRGEVRRQDMSLAHVVTQQIDMLDLTYEVTDGAVIICTFKEAGTRWQQRWPVYSQGLTYK